MQIAMQVLMLGEHKQICRAALTAPPGEFLSFKILPGRYVYTVRGR